MLQSTWKVTSKTFPGFHKIYYNDTLYSNPPQYEHIKIGFIRKIKTWLSWQKIRLFHSLPPRLWTIIPYRRRFDLLKVRRIREQKIITDTFIDNETHQAVDGYEIVERNILNLLFKPNCFRSFNPKKYWKYFDSFAMPDLEQISMEEWTDDKEMQVLNEMLTRAIEEDESSSKTKSKSKLPKKFENLNDSQIELLKQSQLVDTNKISDRKVKHSIKELPNIELKSWDNIPYSDKELESLKEDDYVVVGGLKYPKGYDPNKIK